MKTRRFLIVVMLLFTCIPPLWADDLSTDVRQLKERAAQGDAPVQYNLGLLYSEGQGVLLDYTEAAKWFRLAATRIMKNAQYFSAPNAPASPLYTSRLEVLALGKAILYCPDCKREEM